MQLFITNFKKIGNSIIIDDKNISSQIRRVLRMKIGDKIFAQTPILDPQTKINRYQIQLEHMTSDTIKGNIINTEKIKTDPNYTEKIIAIAMPNKRSKAELITQKLAEIGINKIYFWPAERSIIKDYKAKKLERLVKIAKEATEQSRGRTLPTIEFIKDISKITQNSHTKIIVFDKNNENKIIEGSKKKDTYNKILGIIGPEGGLTAKDYEKIGENYTVQTLGNTILRTETASIIAGWIIKNNEL